MSVNTMRFNDLMLQQALEQWRQMNAPKERAAADNFWFEERVSTTRQQVFEQEVSGAQNPDVLRRSHADYWGDFVRVDHETPHTFLAALKPAGFGTIDQTQKVVRIEALARPLDKSGLTFERLKEAVEKNETAIVDGFLKTWDNSNVRDWRPLFAAFKDEVLEELADEDWPCRMRDRLGLAHYDCADGPIPVALMEYSVGEVMEAANAAGVSCAFTVPTVLDSGPWPYFFPAPPELSCGRAMSLFEVADDEALLAEMLHFRLTYRRDHIARLGEIRTPPPGIGLAALRNHHLTALQMASDRYDYGEEMP